MDLRIGTQIKRLRTAKGLTQEAVAAEVGVSCQAVSKWETGATTPDIALLPGLASLFGVRIDDLFRVDHTDELDRVGRILYHDTLTEENFSYAKRVLDSILKEEPENPELYKRYAELILKRNHQDGRMACRGLERAIAVTPDDEELFFLYRRLCEGGREAVRSGNEQFLDVCKPYAGNQRLGELLTEAMMDLRYYDQAEKQIDGMESHTMQAIFRGEMALARGEKEAARELWLSIPADDHKGQYEAGERLSAIGAYEDAIRCYRNSFEAAKPPRDLSALYALAFLYGRLGRSGEAAQAWELVLQVLANDHGITDGQIVEWASRELAAQRKKAF